MQTFNLSLLFPDNCVATIVCHNENGVDCKNIIMVMAASTKKHVCLMKTNEEVVHAVVKDINDNCDCEAVVVKSDIAVKIVSCN